jgi:hypothetical protein
MNAAQDGNRVPKGLQKHAGSSGGSGSGGGGDKGTRKKGRTEKGAGDETPDGRSRGGGGGSASARPPAESVIKGDASVACIAAASIIAKVRACCVVCTPERCIPRHLAGSRKKRRATPTLPVRPWPVTGDARVPIRHQVTRDRAMGRLNELYPEYGFGRHKVGTAKSSPAVKCATRIAQNLFGVCLTSVFERSKDKLLPSPDASSARLPPHRLPQGYGVPAHLEAIQRLGYCEEHRRSFQPIKGMAAAGIGPTQIKTAAGSGGEALLVAAARPEAAAGAGGSSPGDVPSDSAAAAAGGNAAEGSSLKAAGGVSDGAGADRAAERDQSAPKPRRAAAPHAGAPPKPRRARRAAS